MIRRFSLTLLPSGIFAAAMVTAPARAQDLDADSFSLSGGALDDQGTMQLVHPHIGNPGSFYAGLGVVYSHQPLVYRFEDNSREVIVDGQLSTRVAAGFNLGGAVRFDVDLPVYPYNSIGGASAFSLGEARLGAVIPLVKYVESGVGVAFAPHVNFPTASADSWLSNGGFSGGAVATLGGRVGRLGWALDAGADIGAPATVGLTTLGSALTAGAGLSVDLTDSLLAGLELTTAIDLAGSGGWNEDPTEAHVYLTYGSGKGLTATLGGGAGIVSGVGAPSFRTLLLLGYRAPGTFVESDNDRDGVANESDECPEQAEDLDKYKDDDGCPDPDNDKDGTPDHSDKCPREAEDFDTFADDDGCPEPDNDEDGIFDDDDICPLTAGSKDLRGCPDGDSDGLTDSSDDCPGEPGPENTQGCPDRDGDRVSDARDRCPDVAADPRIDARRSNGCPARVIVTSNAIQIMDKVYFDTNKATIKAMSFSLLDEVAKVIADNPDIRLIEVSGHTDNIGDPAANQILSGARAAAVVIYLNTAGVEPGRLTSAGFGEARPVDSNATEDGRALNRRVEFNILE